MITVSRMAAMTPLASGDTRYPLSELVESTTGVVERGSGVAEATGDREVMEGAKDGGAVVVEGAGGRGAATGTHIKKLSCNDTVVT